MSGGLGLALVTLVVFMTTFGVIAIIGNMSGKAKRDRGLQERVLGVAAARRIREQAPDEGQTHFRFLPRGFVRIVERVLDKIEDPDRTGPLAKVEALLEKVAWSVTPAEFIAGSMAVGLVGSLFGRSFASSPVLLVFFGSLFAMAPAMVAKVVGTKRLAKLQTQLPDTLTVLASSLRAGHSFLQALEAVAQEVPEPSATEFNRAVNEIRLGRESQDALEDMATRAGSADLKWTVLAISIQREVGGNLAEVLDTVAQTIREREQVRRQVDVLSAEGRLSMAVLAGLPIAMALYMSAVNPEYVGLLFSSRLGIVMVTVGAAMWVLGFLWMKKVVKIDV